MTTPSFFQPDPKFPHRPTTKDWERLMVVVERMEAAKASGKSASEVVGQLVDVYTVSYLGVNRAGLNTPQEPLDHQEMVNLAANSWVEGFMYGALFHELGGHRDG